MPTVDEQLHILQRGCNNIVPLDEFKAKLEKSAKTGKPLRIKLGLDPTAPDIHLGFAVVLRKLRQFQDCGHFIDLVIGDGTAMIGDPTGKSVTRPRLTEEQIIENARTYETQLYKILDPAKTSVRRNSEWLNQLDFAKMIEVTSKFTVARILEREDFTNRLSSGQPLHIHEILYPIVQAYDSLMLKTDVEIGGTDQTFNILAGRDIQREYGEEPQIGMFLPLLVGTDGSQKMSKSLHNYVGIFEAPSEIFGKTMSIPDEAMETWYTLCTEIPLDEVATLLAGHPMDAKKNLAQTIVAMYHDADAAAHARAAWEQQFSARQVPDEMPDVEIPADAVEDGSVWVVTILKLAGIAKGTNEARRLVQQGAVSINGEKVTDAEARLTVAGGEVLKAGRKYARLKTTP